MIEFRPMPVPRTAPAQPSCRTLAIRRIADVICELQGSGEPVTEEALAARNIPPAVAARFSAEALDMARRRFVKQA